MGAPDPGWPKWRSKLGCASLESVCSDGQWPQAFGNHPLPPGRYVGNCASKGMLGAVPPVANTGGRSSQRPVWEHPTPDGPNGGASWGVPVWNRYAGTANGRRRSEITPCPPGDMWEIALAKAFWVPCHRWLTRGDVPARGPYGSTRPRMAQMEEQVGVCQSGIGMQRRPMAAGVRKSSPAPREICGKLR